MKSFLLVIILLIISTAIVSAQDIILSQGIDKHEISFEDSVIFTITLRWQGPQHAYLFDRSSGQYLDRLKVRGFSSSISSALDNGQEYTTKTYRYSLVPTISGEGLIDTMTISYVTWPDSLPGELKTEPITVTIGEPQAKRLTSGGISFWWYLIGGLVVLGGITGVILFNRSAKPKEIKLTAEETALNALTELKDRAGGDLKPFQTGLYQLLVDYLKQKFNIDAIHIEGTELQDLLKTTKLQDTEVNQVYGWLTKAQIDKFAPVKAEPGETIRLESAVRQFLEKMK